MYIKLYKFLQCVKVRGGTGFEIRPRPIPSTSPPFKFFTIHFINWLRSLPIINSISKWSLNKQTDRQLYPIAPGISQAPNSALLEIRDGLIAFSKLRFITNFVVRNFPFPFTKFPTQSLHTLNLKAIMRIICESISCWITLCYCIIVPCFICTMLVWSSLISRAVQKRIKQ